MIKILYLLAGISLKQFVDELKALIAKLIEELELRRTELMTYRPVPAMQMGTAEAQQAIARHRHQEAVTPEVIRLSRKILIYRSLPLIAYLLLTIGLLIWIWRLESMESRPTVSANPPASLP